jgi:hypothetical protein
MLRDVEHETAFRIASEDGEKPDAPTDNRPLRAYLRWRCVSGVHTGNFSEAELAVEIVRRAAAGKKTTIFEVALRDLRTMNESRGGSRNSCAI